VGKRENRANISRLLKKSIFKRKMVGLGGLEPPTSPLSEGSAIADKPYSKAFYTICEIHCPIFAPI